VTCVSASECWAVGYYDGLGDFIYQTLIERWDGTSWTIVNSPNTNTLSNALFGVTCGSASDCWAVGDYLTDNATQTLIERWDGTSWAIVSSPNTSATQSNLLLGVTCGSTPDCWAVGYYFNASNVAQTLALRHTASPTPTPTPTGTPTPTASPRPTPTPRPRPAPPPRPTPPH
jgi:hypothetical protein